MKKLFVLITFIILIVPSVTFAQAFADPDTTTPINEYYFSKGTSGSTTLGTEKVTKTTWIRRDLTCLAKSEYVLPGFTARSDGSYPSMRPSNFNITGDGVFCTRYPDDEDTFDVYKKGNTTVMVTHHRADQDKEYYFVPSKKELMSQVELEFYIVSKNHVGVPYYKYLEFEHTGNTGSLQTPGTGTPGSQSNNPASGNPADPAALTETVSGSDEFNKLPNPLGGAGIVTIGDGLSKVVNLIMIIALPFVTIMIIYSGFLFIAAYGNPEKLKKARQTILWTLVGTIILMGATTIGTAIVKTVQKIGQGADNSGDTTDTGANQNTQQNTSSGAGSAGAGKLPDTSKGSVVTPPDLSNPDKFKVDGKVTQEELVTLIYVAMNSDEYTALEIMSTFGNVYNEQAKRGIALQQITAALLNKGNTETEIKTVNLRFYLTRSEIESILSKI